MSFSYQHRYHAGCFADVHKHLTLLAILQHLKQKPTPFCVLDTHAGEGLYDLNSAESQKTLERSHGIDRLWQNVDVTPLVSQFFEQVKAYNVGKERRYYPGSAAIIVNLLREQDRSLFVEKHPQAIAALRAFAASHKNQKISIHERDANEAIKALVPFAEKRGLVFIDPSFEVKTEYETIIQAMHNAYQRFSQGIYALWYPILPEGYHETLLRHLKKTLIPKMWHCEWSPFPKQTTGMIGSGMVVINPPWQLDTLLTHTFTTLNQTLFVGGQFKGVTLC
ncbi:MAG: 23S rRNA (adenine(2030)-N(6))-methyltransferase RlmJ [Candidatus Berkiella sp.]